VKKSQLFENEIKIDKHMEKLNNGSWKKTQINKIRDEKEDFTTKINKTQRIIREYSEHMNFDKL
jgi:hypothetical protein